MIAKSQLQSNNDKVSTLDLVPQIDGIIMSNPSLPVLVPALLMAKKNAPSNSCNLLQAMPSPIHKTWHRVCDTSPKHQCQSKSPTGTPKSTSSTDQIKYISPRHEIKTSTNQTDFGLEMSEITSFIANMRQQGFMTNQVDLSILCQYATRNENKTQSVKQDFCCLIQDLVEIYVTLGLVGLASQKLQHAREQDTSSPGSDHTGHSRNNSAVSALSSLWSDEDEIYYDAKTGLNPDAETRANAQQPPLESDSNLKTTEHPLSQLEAPVSCNTASSIDILKNCNGPCHALSGIDQEGLMSTRDLETCPHSLVSDDGHSDAAQSDEVNSQHEVDLSQHPDQRKLYYLSTISYNEMRIIS